jgi:hypothetical protein
MKLPQNIKSIHREGRTDLLASSGVTPSWWGGDAFRAVGRAAKKVNLKKASCAIGCSSAGGAAEIAACVIGC